jgi:hypothetical protein
MNSLNVAVITNGHYYLSIKLAKKLLQEGFHVILGKYNDLIILILF